MASPESKFFCKGNAYFGMWERLGKPLAVSWPLGSILAVFASILRPSWVILGQFGDYAGALACHGVLGSYVGCFLPSWADLGPCLANLWTIVEDVRDGQPWD